MKNRPLAFGALGVAAALCFASFSDTEASPTPTTMQYQGRLTDSNGSPLEGTVGKLTFRLYNSAAPLGSSTFVWGEAHTNVPIRRGVFSVQLGDGDLTVDLNGVESSGGNPLLPADIDGSPRWIQVQVNADAPLAPATRLGSVPHAMVAGGSVPVGGIVDWYRPDQSSNPPEGWAVCDGHMVMNEPNSPFNGKHLPNLVGKFVEGGSLGAGYGASTGSSVGLPASGGSTFVNLNHTHGVNSHSHNLSVSGTNLVLSNEGGHGHSAHIGDASGHHVSNPVQFHGPFSYYTFDMQGPGPSCSHAIPVHVAPVGGHTHTVQSVGSTDSAGAGTGGANMSNTSLNPNSIDNRPAYVGLVKIIRIK